MLRSGPARPDPRIWPAGQILCEIWPCRPDVSVMCNFPLQAPAGARGFSKPANGRHSHVCARPALWPGRCALQVHSMDSIVRGRSSPLPEQDRAYQALLSLVRAQSPTRQHRSLAARGQHSSRSAATVAAEDPTSAWGHNTTAHHSDLVVDGASSTGDGRRHRRRKGHRHSSRDEPAMSASASASAALTVTPHVSLGTRSSQCGSYHQAARSAMHGADGSSSSSGAVSERGTEGQLGEDRLVQWAIERRQMRNRLRELAAQLLEEQERHAVGEHHRRHNASHPAPAPPARALCRGGGGAAARGS
jgi:hypothetical protein